MTEVRIGAGNNLIVLKDNVVRSGILPEKQVELARNVTVQGNVVVEGGVYAHQLEVDDGPAEFKSAVYTSNELHIKGAAAGTVVFRKAVAGAGVVSAFVTSGRVLFGADINAQTVRLKNCYVGGSIYGTEVELENCVVLGGVFASKKLSMGNVMVGTFHAPEADLAGINYLLYPTAFSVEPMIALPGTELYSLSLADLGSLYKGDPEKEGSGKIQMNLKEDTQRTVLVDEDGANILVNSYSVATRVLVADLADPERLENHFLLKAGALGTQLQKVYTLPKADGTRSSELTVENIADFLFRVLDGSIAVADLEGTVTFDELRERFGYPAAPMRRDAMAAAQAAPAADAEPVTDAVPEPAADVPMAEPVEPTVDVPAAEPVEPTVDSEPVAEPTEPVPAEPTESATVEPAMDEQAEPLLDEAAEPVSDAENEPVPALAEPAVPEPAAETLEPTTVAPASPTEVLEPAPAATPRFCWNCGSPLKPGNKFCAVCGSPVKRLQ